MTIELTYIVVLSVVIITMFVMNYFDKKSKTA